MSTKRAERIAHGVKHANELTIKETDRVVGVMIEQCDKLCKTAEELSQLLSVEPEALDASECGSHATKVAAKRQALAEAINTLANPPAVTKTWVEAFNANLYGVENPYKSRYREWQDEQQAERERQERADAYRGQCTRESELHERRLRGEAV